METIYKVKGKDVGLEFVFKYNLNGDLTTFEKNQALTEQQRLWLYSPRFPETEKLMKVWMSHPDMRKKFEVVKAPADLSFEKLWKIYGYKVAKEDAVKAFKKLTEAEVIKTFISLKPYEDYLARTKIAKAHLSRYLNGKYFNNEY